MASAPLPPARVPPGDFGYIAMTDPRPFYFPLYLLHRYQLSEATPHFDPLGEVWLINRVQPAARSPLFVQHFLDALKHPFFLDPYLPELAFAPRSHPSYNVFKTAPVAVSMGAPGQPALFECNWSEVEGLLDMTELLVDAYNEFVTALDPNFPKFNPPATSTAYKHAKISIQGPTARHRIQESMGTLFAWYARALGWLIQIRLVLLATRYACREDELIRSTPFVRTMSNQKWCLCTKLFSRSMVAYQPSHHSAGVVFHSEIPDTWVPGFIRLGVPCWDLTRKVTGQRAIELRRKWGEAGPKEGQFHTTAPLDGRPIHDPRRQLIQVPSSTSEWREWRHGMRSKPDWMRSEWKQHSSQVARGEVDSGSDDSMDELETLMAASSRPPQDGAGADRNAWEVEGWGQIPLPTRSPNPSGSPSRTKATGVEGAATWYLPIVAPPPLPFAPLPTSAPATPPASPPPVHQPPPPPPPPVPAQVNPSSEVRDPALSSPSTIRTIQSRRPRSPSPIEYDPTPVLRRSARSPSPIEYDPTPVSRREDDRMDEEQPSPEPSDRGRSPSRSRSPPSAERRYSDCSPPGRQRRRSPSSSASRTSSRYHPYSQSSPQPGSRSLSRKSSSTSEGRGAAPPPSAMAQMLSGSGLGLDPDALRILTEHSRSIEFRGPGGMSVVFNLEQGANADPSRQSSASTSNSARPSSSSSLAARFSSADGTSSSRSLAQRLPPSSAPRPASLWDRISSHGPARDTAPRSSLSSRMALAGVPEELAPLPSSSPSARASSSRAPAAPHSQQATSSGPPPLTPPRTLGSRRWERSPPEHFWMEMWESSTHPVWRQYLIKQRRRWNEIPIPDGQSMTVTDLWKGRIRFDRRFHPLILGRRLDQIKAKPPNAWDEDLTRPWNSNPGLSTDITWTPDPLPDVVALEPVEQTLQPVASNLEEGEVLETEVSATPVASAPVAAAPVIEASSSPASMVVDTEPAPPPAPAAPPPPTVPAVWVDPEEDLYADFTDD